MRAERVSLWKGEVVIIACGGARLGAAEDQNSLLRDAALHVRARMCPSTIAHARWLFFPGWICCLLWISRNASDCRRKYVRQHLQTACPHGGGGFKKTRSPFSLTGCSYFYSVPGSFLHFLTAVIRHVFPVPFLASLRKISDFLPKLNTIKLMIFNRREITPRTD